MSFMKWIAAGTTAAMTLCGAAGAFAQSTDPLKVIVFPGGFNWPIFVAQENGYFADNGVTVDITPTPNSKFQMVGLIDGDFDIAMTAMDNVVAYSEGQGAAPTKTEPNIFAFMGVDNGFLRLVATPDVTSYADLKGKQVGVDALTTGYAFVLRKMLELGGLKTSDFEFVEAGGVMSRFGSLMRQEFAATLLVSPLEAAAQREGFNLLGNGSESLGAYQGVVAAARRDWADANADRVQGYISGYRAALTWLYDPANKDAAIAILEKYVPKMAGPVAQVSYKILLDPASGFFPDARIDAAGVDKVLELRSEYGEPQKDLTDASKYIDLRYYEAAAQ